MIPDFLRLGHVGTDLGPYVDGTLEPARRERLDRHVAHCSRCSCEVSEARRQRALTASLGAPEVPASLQERLLQLSCGQVPAPAPWADSRRRSRGIRMAVTVTVASVTGVAVVGVGTLYLVGGRPMTATPVGLTAVAAAAVTEQDVGPVATGGQDAGDLLAMLGLDVAGSQAQDEAHLQDEAQGDTPDQAAGAAQSVATSWPEDWGRPGDLPEGTVLVSAAMVTDQVLRVELEVDGEPVILLEGRGDLDLAGLEVERSVRLGGVETHFVEGWWNAQVGQEIVALHGSDEACHAVLASFEASSMTFAERIERGWRMLARG
ncbi:anti-sigma factor family protein [Serinibacter salmoneus]|uniref:Putative zinc finger protein n=1 Tax=Serinibacter salmoneus TaxID=556530 RepID=A0A2A9CY93_9MICO|nr:zf-HC2 domain-containing protein [Serinibacter salmoneus]PFG19111.1 putative zinc finger protein [Serinibacter salmoneus]